MMQRFRIALLAGLATLALGAIAVPVAVASNGTSAPGTTGGATALKTIFVHGVAKQNNAQSPRTRPWTA
jgi:hypothetical protein